MTFLIFFCIKLKRKTATESAFILDNDFATPSLLYSPPSLSLTACITSIPAERDVARSVTALLHQWFVELPASTRVDGRPAVFTVILEACDIGAEERCEFASTPCALALVTQLVVQDVWLHFHLARQKENLVQDLDVTILSK